MSVNKRKINFYSLEIANAKAESRPSKEVLNLVEKIMKKEKNDRMLDDLRTERFHLLADIEKGRDYCLGFFKSAKYNHTPPLIDKKTLEERKSPKKSTEGEGEKTHFAIRTSPNGKGMFLLETKRTGISIGLVKKYLNRFGRPSLGPEYNIILDVYANEGFLQKLRKMKRLMTVEVNQDKSYVTDTFLSDIVTESSTKDEILIKIGSKRGQSFKTKLMETLYQNVLHKTSGITRLRVIGIAEDDGFNILDTEKIVDAKYAEVALDENGQVVTDSIYESMKQMIGL